MGKFLRSIWSDIAGVAVLVGGSMTVTDVYNAIHTGEIVAMLAGILGGALIGAGRGQKPDTSTPAKYRNL